GGCAPDLVNGEVCDENSDCQSGYCGGGFCCDNDGTDPVCCGVAANCPASFSVAASCVDANTCQGERTDATCNSNRCGSTTVNDDSACNDTVQAKECTALGCADRFCNGLSAQIEPQCCSCVDDSSCNNGLACDGVETCDSILGCQPGTPVAKSDGIACTVDTCVEPNDPSGTPTILNTPDNSLCDDGLVCNGAETCDAVLGCKIGTAVVVDDGIGCTDDSCVEPSGAVSNVPNNSNCDDGLTCTTGTCSPSADCQQTISSGTCLIGGVCYADGAVNPASGCEVCQSGTDQSAWSVTPGSVEICNNIDDDCDTLIDENLDTACIISCNGVDYSGLEICDGGTVQPCSAILPQEVCNNGIDDDCDTVTDEADCTNVGAVGQSGAKVTFSISSNQASNVVTDNGDGTYSQEYFGMANPNTSGMSFATVNPSSPNAPWAIGALPATSSRMHVAPATVYRDRASFNVFVQTKDTRGRAPAFTTTGTITVTGAGVNLTEACTVDAKGRCNATFGVPDGAFAADQTLTVTAQIDTLGALTQTVSLKADAPSYTLQAYEALLEMPRSKFYDASVLNTQQFDVPIFINSNGKKIGAYDVRVNFDTTKLSVISVQKGTATGSFDTPISNATTANSTGQLKLNALNYDESSSDAIGSAINVAIVTFRLKSGMTGDSATSLTANLVKLVDVNNVELASNTPAKFRNRTTNGVTTGLVETETLSTVGIFAIANVYQLYAWGAITGSNDSTLIDVLGIRSDGEAVNASGSASYTVSNSALLSVSSTGLATSQYSGSGNGGWVSIDVLVGSTPAVANVEVMVPKQYDIQLTDAVLQGIAGYPGGKFQTSQLKFLVEWWGLDAESWHDVTDQVTVSVPSGMSYSNRTFASTTPGNYPFDIQGTTGVTLASSSIAVDGSSLANITSLTVVAPCLVENLALVPSTMTPETGKTTLTVKVSGFMGAFQETCQVLTYANFSDGSDMNFTDDPNLVITSADSNVFSSSSIGLLTALADGTAAAIATLSGDSGTLATGQTDVQVKLPTPTSITAVPANTSLALSATDPAATVKGLSTSVQYVVRVGYADGSTIDFTNHPTTTFDAVTSDPTDIVDCTSSGLCSSTGTGTGTATINIGVGLYPTLSGTATVTVVGASGLLAEVYEPYTPTPPQVVDHTFSRIEGTNTYQDGVFVVTMSFTDGSTQDVTSDVNTNITTKVTGTTTTTTGTLSFDKSSGKVSALNPGVVDVIFENGPQATMITPFTVNNLNENVDALVPSVDDSTFSGIVDVGTSAISTYGVFGDGTRRQLSGTREVSGLLVYTSSNTSAATIDQSGLATIRGNASTIFTVDIIDAIDKATAYNPAAELAVDCNLLPAAGDIDMGETVGLAFKDRAPAETFTVVGRINTGGLALGAFDLRVTYDPAMLQVNNVQAGADIVGATFSANAQSQPGTIFINGVLSPASGGKNGNAVRCFNIGFTALAGKGVTNIGGTVVQVTALDAVTP
ncbi:MAG: cohesin domain-containing protein, partial [Myxococcota bacterium]|nr:cohesin domain-containing protein [Myxococcota bacterium]